MSTEEDFVEAVRLLAAGFGMSGGEEDVPYLGQIQQEMAAIKQVLQQSHAASEAIRAEAEAVLATQAESAQAYLEQVEEEDELPDVHPFASVPAGTTVRDLPDGGRLFTLADGAVLRVRPDSGLLFIGGDGLPEPLEPARGGRVRLPDGRVLTLQVEAIRATHDAAGIEGLPLDVDPTQVAENRFRVDLPGGVRLDVFHADRTVLLGNPDGTADIIGLSRIEGIGEEVERRPVPGGATGFSTQDSGHRGIVEANGTVHLVLATGLDLVVRFPDENLAQAAARPEAPLNLPCEPRDDG